MYWSILFEPPQLAARGGAAPHLPHLPQSFAGGFRGRARPHGGGASLPASARVRPANAGPAIPEPSVFERSGSAPLLLPPAQRQANAQARRPVQPRRPEVVADESPLSADVRGVLCARNAVETARDIAGALGRVAVNGAAPVARKKEDYREDVRSLLLGLAEALGPERVSAESVARARKEIDDAPEDGAPTVLVRDVLRLLGPAMNAVRAVGSAVASAGARHLRYRLPVLTYPEFALDEWRGANAWRVALATTERAVEVTHTRRERGAEWWVEWNVRVVYSLQGDFEGAREWVSQLAFDRAAAPGRPPMPLEQREALRNAFTVDMFRDIYTDSWSLFNMPRDMVLDCILGCLDARAVARLSATCRAGRLMCRDPRLWRSVELHAGSVFAFGHFPQARHVRVLTLVDDRGQISPAAFKPLAKVLVGVETLRIQCDEAAGLALASSLPSLRRLYVRCRGNSPELKRELSNFGAARGPFMEEIEFAGWEVDPLVEGLIDVARAQSAPLRLEVLRCTQVSAAVLLRLLGALGGTRPFLAELHTLAIGAVTGDLEALGPALRDLCPKLRVLRAADLRVPFLSVCSTADGVDLGGAELVLDHNRASMIARSRRTPISVPSIVLEADVEDELCEALLAVCRARSLKDCSRSLSFSRARAIGGVAELRELELLAFVPLTDNWRNAFEDSKARLEALYVHSSGLVAKMCAFPPCPLLYELRRATVEDDTNVDLIVADVMGLGAACARTLQSLVLFTANVNVLSLVPGRLPALEDLTVCQVARLSEALYVMESEEFQRFVAARLCSFSMYVEQGAVTDAWPHACRLAGLRLLNISSRSLFQIVK
eukprot:m51a1_g9492 hypothetical protein (834) ;mRNA; r:646895-649574